MLNPSNPQDMVIKQRIDAIFKKYDTHQKGTLSLQELHHFLNDLLASSGNNHRVTPQEAQNVMRSIDQNGDGRINKYELYCCFKYLSSNSKGKGQVPPKMTGQQGPVNPQQKFGVNRQVPIANNYMGGYGPVTGGVAVVAPMVGVMPVAPMTYGVPMMGMGFGMPMMDFQCSPCQMDFGPFDW
jgi:alpha-D-ribose 1-methylphosphonate 5-triphosphate synthase subunit PhnI